MYDLIVLGGGPAGLTAAIYAIRKRLNLLLISGDLGGKTNLHLRLPDLEGYRVVRGAEVVDKFKRELEYLKVAYHLASVERVAAVDGGYLVRTADGGEFNTKSLVVATGAQQQKLEVPGEDEFQFRGLCYSALSYAPLFIDRKTIVIGAGELALRSAAELATVAQEVVLVGPSTSALDSPLGHKLVGASNVRMLHNHRVTNVGGNGFCDRVRVKGPDGHEEEIGADGIFIEMGVKPNTAMLAGLVDLNEDGFVKVDIHGRTSAPGIFAAGDVTDTFSEQVLVAVGDGAKAALSAYDYLLPTL